MLGLLIAVGTWLWYLSLIPRERGPERPVVHQALMGVALHFGAVGVVSGPRSAIAGGIALVLAGYFFFLIVNASLPSGELSVRVGEPLPEFDASDDAGTTVRSQSWRGRRVLLKFFRGSW